MHNRRKQQSSFRGSIINMSFQVGLNTNGGVIQQEFDNCHAAEISMVASAGNKGHKSLYFPSSYQNIIAVGGVTTAYNPRYVSATRGFNFGRDEVTIWGPGEGVNALEKFGVPQCVTGTSSAAGYITGILATYYGYEGQTLTPALARQRLMDNADPFVDFPPGVNWRNSPNLLANTGCKKGQAQTPPLPYLGAPASLPPMIANSQGCQSNHDAPLTSFTLSQGDSAIGRFNGECQLNFQRGKKEGCTLYFNPCSTVPGNRDVVMSVEQLTFNDDQEH